MNLISNILYWISTGLLVPVIVLLIFFFIRALIMIGGFFGQYLQMKKTTAVIYAKLTGLNTDTLADFEKQLPSESGSVLIAYIRKVIEAGADRSKADLLIRSTKSRPTRNSPHRRLSPKWGLFWVSWAH